MQSRVQARPTDRIQLINQQITLQCLAVQLPQHPLHFRCDAQHHCAVLRQLTHWRIRLN